MVKILLVRPGATEYDEQGRIAGTLDMPLSDEGRRQVEAAVDEIKPLAPIAIYASPGEASDETAKLLSKGLNLKVKTLDRLTNLDHGLWQGMLINDVKSKQPKVYRQWQEQPLAVCPPEGETVKHAIGRTESALKKVLKRHRAAKSEAKVAGETATEPVVVLVAPEPLASVVRHVIRDDDLGNFWKTAETCGRWELLENPSEMLAS